MSLSCSENVKERIALRMYVDSVKSMQQSGGCLKVHRDC